VPQLLITAKLLLPGSEMRGEEVESAEFPALAKQFRAARQTDNNNPNTGIGKFCLELLLIIALHSYII